MSRKVTEIPQTKRDVPIEVRRLRVAAYCRVSTSHEEQYHSLEAQIAYYTDYIKRNSNWEFVTVYSDIASGLYAANRPGYQQLMRDCAKRKVDLILVKSLSRFSRDTLETIRQIRFLDSCGKTAEQMPEENLTMIRATFAGMPYIEGTWMTKREGRYYLQYACPGSELNVYADSVYVSEHPLGPFRPAENNPYSCKPGGFLPGAGHGSTLQDKAGSWWHAATMRISVNHVFERRVGLWPAGFDGDDELFCNQRYGDWPMAVERLRDDPWYDPEWYLLSYGKVAASSPHAAGHGPELASDENVQTWWRAASAAPRAWLSVDLGEAMTVHAVQVNFADDPEADLPCPGELVEGPDMGRYIDREIRPTRWLLETSADGAAWEVLADKREALTDLSHDLVVREDGVVARYVRLTVYAVSYGAAPCVSGLRVFGRGSGSRPGRAEATAVRSGPLDFTVSAGDRPDVTGYTVLWGSSPDKLYHSRMVMGRRIDRVRIGALVKGRDYFVRVDAFNENGITEGEVMRL